MTMERYIRMFAGTFVLGSLALGLEGSPLYVSRWFLAFTAFVGLNLLQSSMTRFCPLELVLGALGVRRAAEGARAADRAT